MTKAKETEGHKKVHQEPAHTHAGGAAEPEAAKLSRKEFED